MNTKLTQVLLFLLIFLSPLAAFGQQAPAPQHIIIIVQENRTPDNLYQDPNLIKNGADISATGYCTPTGHQQTMVPLQGTDLDACFDPQHGHMLGFEPTYDNGNWDGACNVTAGYASCYTGSGYATYTYVQNTVNIQLGYGTLTPYWQIAETYGFANYMFQTNQGPSFLAHQFLFSGTSAPVGYGQGVANQNQWQLFAVENPTIPVNGIPTSTNTSGCFSPSGTVVNDLYSTDFSGNPWPTETSYYDPSMFAPNYAGFPCYTHPSMANLLDSAGISWKYYIQSRQERSNIWTAPNALSAICSFDPNGGSCSPPNGNTDWSNVDYTVGDILTDINNCTSGNCNASTCSALPAVSWVIPDGSWSDHPGPLILNNNQKVYPSVGGPSWVAAIVNAIGVQSVGGTTDCGYWNNTTILITWDDWGGWYDHIAPYLPPNSSYPQVGYPGVTDNNGDWYVYGFRVPLLVVSTYATPGYISGNLNNGQGKTKNPPYIHDFGSILGYVEWAFGLPPYPATSQNTCGIADATGLGCNYPYADYFAPDGKFECPPSACGSSPYPLEDFFSATSHAFTAITGAQYPSSCFTTDVNSCFPYYPADPDDDGIDLQD